MATIESPSAAFNTDRFLIIENGQNGSHSVTLRFNYPKVPFNGNEVSLVEYIARAPTEELARAQMQRVLLADWEWAEFRLHNGYTGKDPLILAIKATLDSIRRTIP